MLQHRPFINSDLQMICSFPQNKEELFYFFPKATYPLTPAQLQSAIDQRSDATIVEQNGDIEQDLPTFIVGKTGHAVSVMWWFPLWPGAGVWLNI